MTSEPNPYAPPPAGAARRQEVPGFDPWTWALRHKIVGGMAALVIGVTASQVVATFYGLLGKR